ncbi:hypothetical protein PC116_g19629 [Phytophthora cactorum]|uniref:Uncharacterized protein n=1 Tax=Phytophthora cactorum TaxID=29920 RepID=A0A329SI35_9STRA|nr:hypothetical protein Pcac1_g1063 [Phytophthora cactorum]KAG2801432.1 hypothetical protein PC111_g19539 [Phytophthora cactorum]KAG2811709.1 hypothetical protein PC112_g15489 [Phytophthora cactorum]KAG2861808.1 hypothetical protein PC113_g6856 [Phytophthora cactorum]KAG2882650.1 hypothetical protein PC114_g20915 [Phytophthora cactorum]
MVKILEEAEKTNALVKSGQLPTRGPKLEKFEIDMS